MNKFLTGSSNVIKYGAPVFDIALGIYNVIAGTKNMDPLFNHQIIAASRGISKQIDDMIEVYDTLTDTVHTESEDIHTIYSIDVEVADGNWDHFSGVYFILSDGTKECSTKGAGYQSLSAGWVTLNMSRSNNLNQCLFFEFYGSKLSVAVVHVVNTWTTRDKVTINTIQVSVDGNHLPSFEVEEQITVTYGNRTEFFKVKPMYMKLKAITVHTSQGTVKKIGKKRA